MKARTKSNKKHYKIKLITVQQIFLPQNRDINIHNRSETAPHLFFLREQAGMC
jgi:hypothetical protein